MKHTQPDNTHFFAASASTWMTTTPERGLDKLIELMAREQRVFNVYKVPLPHTADYQIKMYRPQVEGAEWLGCFDFEEK